MKSNTVARIFHDASDAGKRPNLPIFALVEAIDKHFTMIKERSPLSLLSLAVLAALATWANDVRAQGHCPLAQRRFKQGRAGLFAFYPHFSRQKKLKIIVDCLVHYAKFAV